MEQRITIAFAAGKSGGHIVPCLELARRIKEEEPSARFVFFAADTELDKKLLAPHTHFISYFLPHMPFPGKRIDLYPWFCITLITNFITVFYTLMYHKPRCIISTGELIAVPTCFAAWLMRIPIELYELNVIPGRTIQLLSKLATTIHCSFRETILYLPKHTARFTPYPVRYQDADRISRSDACQLLGINAQKKIIFVMGGSQGSLFMNQQIKKWLDEHQALHSSLHIIHQTGANDPFNWHAYYAERALENTLFSYNPELAPLYCAADFIICRSGAGTLFEAAFFGQPIITIPLEIPGNDHQLHNALALAEKNSLITVIRQQEVLNLGLPIHL